jgi:hypothetical protein
MITTPITAMLSLWDWSLSAVTGVMECYRITKAK